MALLPKTRNVGETGDAGVWGMLTSLELREDDREGPALLMALVLGVG